MAERDFKIKTIGAKLAPGRKGERVLLLSELIGMRLKNALRTCSHDQTASFKARTQARRQAKEFTHEQKDDYVRQPICQS